jgi:hypothetical protein
MANGNLLSLVLTTCGNHNCMQRRSCLAIPQGELKVLRYRTGLPYSVPEEFRHQHFFILVPLEKSDYATGLYILILLTTSLKSEKKNC